MSLKEHIFLCLLIIQTYENKITISIITTEENRTLIFNNPFLNFVEVERVIFCWQITALNYR